MDSFNEFITQVNNVLEAMVPLLVVIVLIALIVFLVKLIRVIIQVQKSLVKVNETLIEVDKSIDKLQGPLDTAAKIANTVDVAHDTALGAVDKVVSFFQEHFETVKTFVGNLFHEKPKRKPTEDSAVAEKEREDGQV